jgi:hypothetical protein
MPLKKGSGTTNRYRLTEQEADRIREMRGESVNNINENSALDQHLKERGIDKTDVTSVKHWQSASGELRFSVVTKEGSEIVTLQEQFAPILKDLQSYSPKLKHFKREIVNNPHCLIIDPADIHVGKYSAAAETGSSYNIEKAVRQVDEGINGILSKAYGHNVDKLILVIGNDCLHTDGATGATSRGTRQDMSGMWWEAFIAAKEMYVKAIELILPFSDIEVVYNPSNHDYAAGFMLTQTLEAYFRNSKNITFDSSIKHRKYTTYGNSMIGTSHGDGGKIDVLPLLMAQEEKHMWADTTYRYLYLHHLHHMILHKFLSGKDYPGVTIQHLRSPSATDSWHAHDGYTGVPKAIEGFLHSFDMGQVAHLTHHV